MKRETLDAFVRRTTKASGVPYFVADIGTLDLVAASVVAPKPTKEQRASLDAADGSTSAERARAGRRSGTDSDQKPRRRRSAQPKRAPQRKRKERRPAPPDVDPLKQ